MKMLQVICAEIFTSHKGVLDFTLLANGASKKVISKEKVDLTLNSKSFNPYSVSLTRSDLIKKDLYNKNI